MSFNDTLKLFAPLTRNPVCGADYRFKRTGWDIYSCKNGATQLQGSDSSNSILVLVVSIKQRRSELFSSGV